MKVSLFNDGWLYGEQPAGTPPDISPDGLRPVDIPHDMLISDARDLYRSCVGLYQKTFILPQIPDGKLLLRFDGVYPECRVLLNDREICHHTYGYSAFFADMTEAARAGENTLNVWVNHLAPNSRWYSGAGIFRDVELIALPPSHLVPEGIYIHTEKTRDGFSVQVSAEVCGEGSPEFTLYDPDGKPVYSGSDASFEVNSPALWDVSSDNRYTLRVSLVKDGNILDTAEERFGFREFHFDPNEGFFLNGRHMKLNGVCLHHDLGALGAAFNADALRRQLTLMKEMGANAVRTSHNMPARQLMELCDEMGILVVSEAYDMWGRPKTEFDNARFFGDTYAGDVASWVRRDRNRPSLIMWSIGNEIYDTHDGEYGREEMRALLREVRKNDPLKNALTTFGSNYIPWENTQKCAEELDVVGGNYAEHIYSELHEKHPGWRIYGSETASRGQSRGIYHFPFEHTARTYEDMQMSSLENSRSGAGDRTPQSSIIWDRDCPFSAGQFIWTGIDYLGEPSPYSTKNAYYGQCDTAGFRKDSFYLYKAAWTDAPLIHIMPYWDFNGGQLIDVCAYTNAPRAELFLNNRSLGVKEIDLRETYMCRWQIPYEKGELRAAAYDLSGNTLAEDVQRSFGDGARIVITSDRTELPADGRSLIFPEISTADKNGTFVANGRSRMNVKVSGAGRLVGLDNGDSTDYESFKCTSRKLFSGRMLAIIASNGEAGEITLEVTSEGLPPAKMTFTALPCEKPEGVSCQSENSESLNAPAMPVPIRKIELTREGGDTLTPEAPIARVTAKLLPENAGGGIRFSAVTDSGIVTNIAEVTQDGLSAIVRAIGDGRFRLRCTAANGKDCADIISDLEYTVTGMGSAVIDPYSFVSATFYSRSDKGALDEVIGGGVRCAANGKTCICFDNVDFGRDFSGEITIPIIRWHRDDSAPVEVWEKMPGEEGARLLWSGVYDKKFVWQTYLPLTCKLSEKLTGLTSICIVCECGDEDFNVQGFICGRLPRAYETLTGAHAERVYGDSFRISGTDVLDIGNNVTIDLGRLGFTEGISSVRLCGRTENELEAVHFIFTGSGGERRFMAEFPRTDDFSEFTFPLPCEAGEFDVRLMFLPGCRFSFRSVAFLKDSETGE